jgi:tRNA-specific 2-thiouridylase
MSSAVLSPAKPKVLVAMSGGVDSSLAAVLLQEQGHEIVGVNMRTHRLTPDEIAQGAKIKTCCSPTDAKDARACADRGDFPFYVIDVEPEFERAVITPFINDYASGRTPNPCVLCNNHVKLGLLLEKATLWGCELVATGHYTRKVRHPETGRWTLQRAADTNKDQGYYLFGLSQQQLDRLIFPLGDLTKEEVRRQARTAELPTANKPESQEICFVPDNNYRRFLRGRFEERGIPMPRGKFISTTGEVLGEHEGIANYTIGQRRGLGISGPDPLYVVALDTETNAVIVGPHEALFFTGLIADKPTWMGWEGVTEARWAKIQIRYRHAPVWGRVMPSQREGIIRVTFDEPQRAVTPGQAVVFWDEEDRVAGGAWILEGVRKEEDN